MSYEVYKILHIVAVLVMTAGLAVGYYSTQPKHIKIVTGISSFLVLVGGMGLLARLGVDHGAGFPGWVIAKMTIWLLISITGPVFAKRLSTTLKPKVFWGFIFLLFLAIYIAVQKPF
jgi:uncharacterized membrane protein SirB2